MRARLRPFAELVVRAEPLLVLLLIPGLIPLPARVFYYSAYPALLAVPVVWLCAWISRGHFVERTPLDWPIALLILMLGVSLLVTSDVRYTGVRVVSLLRQIAAYYAIVRLITGWTRLRRLTQLYYLLGIWTGMVTLFAADWQQAGKVPEFTWISHRLPQFFIPLCNCNPHPMTAGGFLALFVPLPLVLLLHALTNRRTPDGQWLFGKRPIPEIAIHAASALVTGGALLLTQTRGAWLGFGLAMMAVLLIHSQRTRAMLLLVGLVSAILFVAGGPARIVGHLATGLTITFNFRWAIWSAAIATIPDAPLTGAGFVPFSQAIGASRYLDIQSVYSQYVPHAHNQLLYVALSLGLPGLIAYLGVWLGAAWLLARVRIESRDPRLWVLAEGLAAGLLAHFLASLTETLTFDAQFGIAFWAALAIVAGAHRAAFTAQANGALATAAAYP